MIYTESFYIGYSDTNRELVLSDSAILRIFENIGSMHSAVAGDGMKDSPARWFLTANKIKIYKRPAHEERITVKTWIREARGFSSCREIEIYNDKGELAVTGISNWARINIETGRPERMSAELYARYEPEPDRTNFDSAWIGKMKEPDTYSIQKSYYIDRYFIDANNHMNNVYYIDLASCILPNEIYDSTDIKSFEISYRKAIAYGETVKCCYAKDGDKITVAVKSEDGAETRAIIQMSVK